MENVKFFSKNNGLSSFMTSDGQVYLAACKAGGKAYVFRFEPVCENQLAEVLVVPDEFHHEFICLVFRKMVDAPRKLMAEMHFKGLPEAFLIKDTAIVIETVETQMRDVFCKEYNLGGARAIAVSDGQSADVRAIAGMSKVCDEAYVNLRGNLLLHFIDDTAAEFMVQSGKVVRCKKVGKNDETFLPNCWRTAEDYGLQEIKKLFD